MAKFYVQAHEKIVQSGVPNFRGCRIPVPTHLNISEWSRLLEDYNDKSLVDCLKFGFPLGYRGKALSVSVIKNHKGATGFPNFIKAYLDKEGIAKNILGPFDGNPLVSPLSISPLKGQLPQ